MKTTKLNLQLKLIEIGLSGFNTAVCDMPSVIMDRNEELEYNEEYFSQNNEWRKVQYSSERYQEIMKKVLKNFDEIGVFD